MKKILLLIFVTIISVNTYSQTLIETYKNCLGYYNEYQKKFDFGEYNYSNITFRFYDAYISVDDDAHSIYRIIKYLPKEIYTDYSMTTTQCLDEKNRYCKVALIKYSDDSFSIDIIYDNKAYIYIVK